ncbi:MAG TPA: hypothetical protein VGI60_13620 [Chthoniobacterales bacterium]|jgi:hypothetical protein
MTEREARAILQVCRPGEIDRGDLQIAEALQLVEQNPELARWLDEEQAFDRAMTAQLANLPAPLGLKTRILAQNNPAPAASPWSRWIIALAGAAALLFLLAQIADTWRRRPSTAELVPQYASEMVSFIKVKPSLEMMSGNLGEINGWLQGQNAAPKQVPPRLAALEPVGCRILSFRGHKVTLICFRRDDGRLAHLFVVDRAAFPGLQPGAPIFKGEGEWMTAIWLENDRVYMLATEGDRETTEHFLPRA